MSDTDSLKTESIETLLRDLYPGGAPKLVRSLVVDGNTRELAETLAEIRKQERSASGGAYIQSQIVCDDIWPRMASFRGDIHLSAGEKERAIQALYAEMEERKKTDPRVAHLIASAKKWALFVQVAELIYQLASGKPAVLYSDEVYALLPANFQEQGALTRAEAEAEAEARQIEDRARAAPVRASGDRHARPKLRDRKTVLSAA